MRRGALVFGALAALTAPSAARQADPAVTGAALRAHVAFLASDNLRGRYPGTPGFTAAAAYVAARFRAAGLRPGGTNGYLESVPLVRVRPEGPGAMRWMPAAGGTIALRPGVDFFPDANPGIPHAAAEAAVTFVGYGVSLPALGHDDYARRDVRGRIVAFAVGGPPDLRGEERGVVWDLRAKLEAAAAHGAIGAVTVQIDRAEGAVPFATSAAAAARPEVAWARADGTSRGGPAAVPLLGTLSPAGAARIFGPRWAANVRQGRTDAARLVPMAARGTLAAVTDTRATPLPSSNIVGLLPGSDPALAKEIIVVSAHLGELTEGSGDRIYNGALDNAIGVAGVIEIARRLATAPVAPRRTTLFLVITGEEGLIGSDYFTRDPAMPIDRIVADINLDMPILTYPFEDVTVFGGPHSTLGASVAAVLARHGLPSTPDPAPGDSLFIRSDQFSFARVGIPSVMLWPGRKGSGAATEVFLKHRYHQPSDDLTDPIDWIAAERFMTVVGDAVITVADASDRPRWLGEDRLGQTSLTMRKPGN